MHIYIMPIRMEKRYAYVVSHCFEMGFSSSSVNIMESVSSSSVNFSNLVREVVQSEMDTHPNGKYHESQSQYYVLAEMEDWPC